MNWTTVSSPLFPRFNDTDVGEEALRAVNCAAMAYASSDPFFQEYVVDEIHRHVRAEITKLV